MKIRIFASQKLGAAVLKNPCLNKYSLNKAVVLISILCLAQNTSAQRIAESWWFVFVKENLFSENRFQTKKLFSAVKNNSIPSALSALKEGAVINARDAKGRTPLHWAVYMNNFEMAEFLLQQEADPNALNRRHRTPLHWAVLKPDIKFTRLLLEYKADPNILDNRKRAPLHWVILKPNEDTERSTLRKRTSAASQMEPHPALYWEESDLEKVRLLLEYEADPNLRTTDRKTPLYIAAAYERFPIVQLLVEFGADVNLKDYADDAPLHLLSKRKKTSVHTLTTARFLLENKADPNALSLAKASPTHLAEFHRHTQLYNLFLEFGGRPKKYNPCMRLIRKLKSKIN